MQFCVFCRAWVIKTLIQKLQQDFHHFFFSIHFVLFCNFVIFAGALAGFAKKLI
jgi:hypothetical protein